MPRYPRRVRLFFAARRHEWAPFQALWYSTFFGVQRCCPVRSDAAARTHGATACSPACAPMISVPRLRRLLGIPRVLQSASANFLAEPLERPHETYEHYVTLRDSLTPTGHK